MGNSHFAALIIETDFEDKVDTVIFNVLVSRIKSQFECLTKAQVDTLKYSQSDRIEESTKALLAELVLEIAKMFSHKKKMAIMNKKEVSNEKFFCIVDRTLDKVCSHCMDGEEINGLQRVSLVHLVWLIVEETKRILSHFDSDTMESVTICPINPDTLDDMIRCVCVLLKRAFSMIYMGGRPDTPRKSPSIYLKEAFLVKRTQVIGEILCKGVEDITETLLRNVPDPEYELLQLDCSLKIKAVAEDISQLIVEHAQSLKHSDAAGQRPEHSEWPEMTVEGIEIKTKNFFEKLFTRTLIYRILAQLMELHQDSIAESRESIQSLVDDIDSLIFRKEGEEDVLIVDSDPFCDFDQLSDVVYKHITGKEKPEDWKASLPESLAALYADIQEKIHNFLTLIVWWMNSQARDHSKEFTHNIMCAVESASLSTGEPSGCEDTAPLATGEPSGCEDTAPLATGEPSGCEDTASLATGEPSGCEDTAPLATDEPSECQNTCAKPVEVQVDQNKLLVRILVKNLFERTAKKLKINCVIPETLIEHLVEKTWVEVKGIDIPSGQGTIKILTKTIYKDLCKRWGCPDLLLFAMYSEDPDVGKSIASSIRKYLTAPKPRTISTFFSSVGRAISKCFTFRNKITPVS